MKQSILFTKTKKEAPKDEVSINAKLLIRGGFVEKVTAGVYSILPLGWRVMKNIEQIIREEMDKLGGQEIFMPALHPKENWIKTGRWETYEDVYKVKHSDNKEFALGPTHEEIVVPLAQKFIQSYKDLPAYMYQFQNKFRMELRAKSGILRGREFIMKDFYSFHLTEEDLDNYYEKVKDAYFKVFERAGLKEQTYLTYASGGTFSKYSHEYQTITSAGEDIIYICNKCNLAINREIKEETPKCPDCECEDFREEKAVEVGNIFKLKDKYTKPFEMNVIDKEGKSVPVLMGCYGIGLNRLMGTIVEVLHDENGIIWPKEVAPFAVHLISLNQNEKCEEIYKQLTDKGVEVLYDDRDVTAGEKFADSDLIGIPTRIVVSKKTLESGEVEVKERGEKEAKRIKLEEIEQI